MSEEAEADKSARKMPRGVHDGMIKVSGKDYLPVPYRLVWMRDEKPLWGISTEIIEAAGYTLVRATVTDEAGRTISTAHKAVTAGGKFPPIEKAETGAMGRALGAAGFGTQFGELDDEEPGVMGGIADSPVSRPRHNNSVQDRLNRSVDAVGRKNGYTPGDWDNRQEPPIEAQHVPHNYEPNRPANVDADGVVHDNIPSRPPASARQQAMGEFRRVARAIDERFGHPSFKPLDMAKMVSWITEDGREVSEVGKDLEKWAEATNVLRQFKAQFPDISSEDALKAIRYKFSTDAPMVEFTAAMWLNPFWEAAEV